MKLVVFDTFLTKLGRLFQFITPMQEKPQTSPANCRIKFRQDILVIGLWIIFLMHGGKHESLVYTLWIRKLTFIYFDALLEAHVNYWEVELFCHFVSNKGHTERESFESFVIIKEPNIDTCLMWIFLIIRDKTYVQAKHMCSIIPDQKFSNWEVSS